MSPDIRSGLRPPLTPRWRRFAILAALASEAGSHGTGNPSLEAGGRGAKIPNRIEIEARPARRRRAHSPRRRPPGGRQHAGASRVAARRAARQARRTLASPRLPQAKTGRMPVFRV